MIYIGVDHGTTAVRFAAISKNLLKPFKLEISRKDAALMTESDIMCKMENYFGITKNQIAMIGVTYSMGDGITTIENIKKVRNRGVKTIEAVGEKTGAGSKVFDSILHSDIPAIIIPGIHDGSDTDKRLNIFSHSTSPEKISIAYSILCKGFNNFILSDISSNTVTLGVVNGKLIGAIDACIFAPGLVHGPLDVQALRDIDAGKINANEAFMHAGVLKRTGYENLEDLITGLSKNESTAILALDTISLFASMEIVSMQLLLKDYNAAGEIFIEGSVSKISYVTDKICQHLNVSCHVLDKWSAAIGGAEIARSVVQGSRQILGIKVNYT